MKYIVSAVLMFAVSGLAAYGSSVTQTGFGAWLFFVSIMTGVATMALLGKYFSEL